jgi:uncharacterized protein (DUF1501 family)
MQRRDFLKLSAVTALSLALPNKVFAEENSDYKAIVVLYLQGGNDGLNMFIPSTDDEKTGYPPYARGRENIKVNNNTLELPLDDNGKVDLSGGNPYNVDGDLDTAYTKGFYKHTNLPLATNGIMPELAHLVDRGKVAIVSNVGNLIEPATKEELKSGTKPKPPFLFAHNHQTTLMCNGIASKIQFSGWAGRVYDLWQGINGESLYRLNMGIGANSHMFYGDKTEPLIIHSSGPSKYMWNIKREIYDDLLEVQTGDIFEDLYTNKQKHSFLMQDILYNDWTTKVPQWSSTNAYGDKLFSYPGDKKLQQKDIQASPYLLEKLKSVAKWAYIGKSSGLKRQIFYTIDAGYDTHGNQWLQHPRNLRGLSLAIGDFYKALEDMQMENNVTLMIVSEFGRSLGDNGNGTDHAWGNHYFVLGGAVKGGVYGELPDLNLSSDDDIDHKGRLIPKISMSQYYATVLKWFGMNDEELNRVLPELKNFEIKDLGFMG